MKSIYKKSIFLFLFFCIPFFVKANWDLDIYNNTKNVNIESYISYQEFETPNKIDVLMKLAQKLIEQSDHPNLEVFMKIDYLRTYQDSYYTLGYDVFKVAKLGYLEEKEYEGLIIFVKDKDINIKKILTILSNALDKIEYIKTNQTKIYKENRYSVSNNLKFDTLISIPLQEVNKYAFSESKALNSILNEKIYIERKFLTQKQEGIDYYYQNNKFHFYTSNKKKEQDLLVTDNILEIVGNAKDGYFIFNTDSTFYYLTMKDRKVKGKFKIDGVLKGRQPIYNYEHKTKPLNLFYLNVSNSPTQILFVPDRNFAYANYREVEKKIIDILIQNRIEKNTKLKHANDFKFNFEIAFYISLVIILGLLILIWQRKRK